MPAWIISGVKWLVSTVALPFLKWITLDLIVPAIKKLYNLIKRNKELQEKVNAYEKQANQSSNEYAKNPTVDNFSNLP